MPERAIEFFLRTVETGSLKAAAEESRLDPATVSRAIAALEARLGAKLLIRSTRRSRPTEAGQAYYDGIRTLAAEQAALEAQISGLAAEPKGLLRVAAPVDFGVRFVAPVVGRLLDAHRELSVDMQMGSHFSDLREAGIDVAIRIGKLSDSALIGRKLGSVPRVLVAAPSYLDMHGVPTEPDELAEHAFVFYRPAPGPLILHLSNAGVAQSVSVRARCAVNSVTGVRALVLAGQGLHLGPLWAFENDLDRGDLVSVLPGWQGEPLPLHAVFLPGPYRPAKLVRFLEEMTAQVREERSLA